MSKPLLKVITILVITVLLAQDVALAGVNDFLAPDAKKDLAVVVSKVGTSAGEVWRQFQGAKRGQPMKFPAGISEDKLNGFKAEYGDFGIIEGIIGSNRTFVYDPDPKKQGKARLGEIKNKAKFDKLIQRLDGFLSKLAGFPGNTLVRITSTGRHPLLYHKEDRILEIHAMLLTPEVDDETLEFALRHDERHCVMIGLQPWIEELVNIYIDAKKLQTLEKDGTADKIVDTLRTLEGEQGYWRILGGRIDIRNEKFLLDVCEYIIKFHLKLIAESVKDGKGLLILLRNELGKPTSPLMTLWNILNVCSISFTGSPDSPADCLHMLSLVLCDDRGLNVFNIWKKAEREILEKLETSERPLDANDLGPELGILAAIILPSLWKEKRNEIEMALGTDGLKRYFKKDKLQQLLDSEILIKGYDVDLERDVFVFAEAQDNYGMQYYLEAIKLKEISDRFKDKRQQEVLRHLYKYAHKNLQADFKYNIQFALELAGLNADFITICAAIISGTDTNAINNVEILSSTEKQKLKHILLQSVKIQNVPFDISWGSRRALQNYMSLLVQLSTDNNGAGDPEILLFTLLGVLQKIRKFEDKPDVQERLDRDEDNIRYLLEMVSIVYAPLAEFVGIEDAATNLRDMWLKITDPALYAETQRKAASAVTERHVVYGDLRGILEGIKRTLEEKLSEKGIMGVKIKTRVKSVYSIDEKIKSKPEKYPEVEFLEDILGIQIIFKTSAEYEAKKEAVWNAIRETFKYVFDHEKKSAEEYGYDEEDFIGRTDDVKNIDVQIYPSQKDYKTYHNGSNAHWVYKLKRLLKEKGQVQEFDEDILGRIQGMFSEDYSSNFHVVYDALSRWIFAGVIVKRKGKGEVRYVRLPKGSIDADLASLRGVDELGKAFTEVKDVTGVRTSERGLKLPDRQITCKDMRPGVFFVVKGTHAQKSGIFVEIKRKTQRIRTYILASFALDKEEKRAEAVNRGREVLVGVLNALGYDRSILNKSKKSPSLVDRIINILGLADTDEFYRLVYTMGQDGEIRLYNKAYKQLVEGLTGKVPQDINTEKEIETVLKKMGIEVSKKINKRLLLIGYIITGTLRGKVKLADAGIKTEDESAKRRLEYMAIEHGLDSLEQLYASAGIYPESFALIQRHYSTVSVPSLEFRVKNDRDKNKVYEQVNRVLDEEDIKREEFDIYTDGVAKVPIYPPKLSAQLVIGRVLDSLKRISEIEGVKFVSSETKSLRLGGDRGTVLLGGGVPPLFGAQELLNAINIPFNSVWLVYIGAVVLVAILGIRLIVYLWRNYLRQKINTKIDELFEAWDKYDAKPLSETDLLAPFYDSAKEATGKIDFREIVSNLSIDAVQEVVTKKGISRKHTTQGYRVMGHYQERYVRLFVFISDAGCKDISYCDLKDLNAYHSLGEGITNACKDTLMVKIGEFKQRQYGRVLRKEEYNVIIPMEGRAEFERFNCDNVFSRSMLSRFPKTGDGYPMLGHKRYILLKDDLDAEAYYFPKTRNEKGIIGKVSQELFSAVSALHEIAHGIYDYSREFREKVEIYFGEHPNRTLERNIARDYGYKLDNPEFVGAVINEAFAFTLSEFAAMNVCFVRIRDAVFFAENGFIEPWMNPLELGYTKAKFDHCIDEEYYMRVIEFLIERSRSESPYYKLSSTGKWVKAPCGNFALEEAGILALTLIKSHYNLAGLSDVVDAGKFRADPFVLWAVGRFARVQLGYKKSADKRWLSLRRRSALRQFKHEIGRLRLHNPNTSPVVQLRFRSNQSIGTAMKYLSAHYPWVEQAFFEEAVLKNPQILVIDVKTLQDISENSKRELIRVINQVEGRVIVISSDGEIEEPQAMNILTEFLTHNRSLFNKAVCIKTDDILRDVNTKNGSEKEGDFVRRLYGDIQKKFRVRPEAMVVFTNKTQFVRSWRNIAQRCLFYVMDKDSLYMTNEKLLAIQVLLDRKEFDLGPEQTIKLLPERFYGKDALDELERLEVDRAA